MMTLQDIPSRVLHLRRTSRLMIVACEAPHHDLEHHRRTRLALGIAKGAVEVVAVVAAAIQYKHNAIQCNKIKSNQIKSNRENEDTENGSRISQLRAHSQPFGVQNRF